MLEKIPKFSEMPEDVQEIIDIINKASTVLTTVYQETEEAVKRSGGEFANIIVDGKTKRVFKITVTEMSLEEFESTVQKEAYTDVHSGQDAEDVAFAMKQNRDK